MAKRKKKTVPTTTTAYPSRARFASITSTKEVNAALEAFAQRFGISSISWAARRMLTTYLRLQSLDSLLQRIRPEHIAQVRGALVDILGEEEED